MKLKDIIQAVAVNETAGSTEKEIAGIHMDSRCIEKDFLFVAVKGTQTDGHDYIDKAIEKGATAVVCEVFPTNIVPEVTYIKVNSTEDSVGKLATAFYGNPTSKLDLIGVKEI